MHFNKIYETFTQKINLKDKALNKCINSILIKNFAKLVSNMSKNITNKDFTYTMKTVSEVLKKFIKLQEYLQEQLSEISANFEKEDQNER